MEGQQPITPKCKKNPHNALIINFNDDILKFPKHTQINIINI